MTRAMTLYAVAVAAAVIVFGAGAAHAQFQRTVLLEEFTSLTCKPCTTATPIINELVRQKLGRVVSVRYHANLPFAGDPYYEAIKDQINSRKTYYAVSALPFGRIDGSTNVTVTVEGEVQDKADSRLDAESPIRLAVTQVRDGNQLRVKVTATAGEAGLSGGDYKLRVVAVEGLIHDTRFVGDPKYNGETELYDVVRQLVNGGDGTAITVEGSGSKDFDFAFPIGDGWNVDQIYTVAFVQNDDNQEIVQTGYSPKPVSGVNSNPPVADSTAEIHAYPNPASGSVTITYHTTAPREVRAELYDMVGRRVAESSGTAAGKGWHDLGINVRDLLPGAYTCVVRSDEGAQGCRVIVMR